MQPLVAELPDVRGRAARWITDVVAPANVLAVLLLVTGWHAAGTTGVAWALGAAALAVGLPLALVAAGVRRGRYTDLHVRVREQRLVPLVTAVCSTAATAGLLAAFGGPPQLIALVLAIGAGLFTGGVITLWWKVSGHTAVVGAAAVILIALFGPPAALTLPVALPVAWARVVLRDHTPAQTAVGFLVGAAVAAAVFVPLT